ncbi:MAG: hypothetical protein KC423_29265, partial [Anaerolineales bacterium]|nr:hypothetical protein [Anaerolineales bacterium]
MKHTIRFTQQKIGRYQKIVEALVYRQQVALPPFRYQAMPELDPTLLSLQFDDSDWQVLAPHTYWGGADTHFVLRNYFTVPANFT